MPQLAWPGPVWPTHLALLPQCHDVIMLEVLVGVVLVVELAVVALRLGDLGAQLRGRPVECSVAMAA